MQEAVNSSRLQRPKVRPWLCCLLLLAPLTAEAQSWKGRVDRLWGDVSIQTPASTCQMYLVRTLPPLFRGSISARDCVVKAIIANRSGDRALARSWLRAGYCGDKTVRQQLEGAGDAAVEYAVQKYGPAVP